MKVWLLRAWRMPIVFFRHRMDQGFHNIFGENPSCRFMLLSAVRSLLFPSWTSPGAWIFWPGYWCHSASADDRGRYCVLQHLTFLVGVVEYYGGVPWPWSVYIDRFAESTLSTREGNVTYTWWFKGQSSLTGRGSPEILRDGRQMSWRWFDRTLFRR